MSATGVDYDTLIIGAGPAGLALARALGARGLSVAVVERQPLEALQLPAFDGREIALTHRSATMLRGLDAWDRIPAAEISPLGEARVLNGPSGHTIRFQPGGTTEEKLGYLVANHLIRRALYEAAVACPNVRLLAGHACTGIETNRQSASLTLADGARITARLVVAADTRFSETRRRMGIAASMRDFGKTMMVCRMTHARPHHEVATEWFGYGQTIAMLPLNDAPDGAHVSSLVLTLPSRQTERLLALDEVAFSAEITQRYEHRLGAMQLVSTRHCYPLVGVYASRFVAERFALVGDAAVGMHPVTAHGFNFGLLSQHALAGLMTGAAAAGRDIGAPLLLRRYQMLHRRATRPLYLATNTTALLYSDDRLPARLLRNIGIRLGERLPPVREAVVSKLMAGSSRRSRPSLLRALVP